MSSNGSQKQLPIVGQRSRISSRRVPGPSHQPSVDQSVATNAPICRNAPKPKKRELLQPQAPQAPPRSGAAQSAIDLSNGAGRSRPKLPSLATNRTADSASSHAPSSTSPPSRTASPAKSNSSKVASFMKSLNPLRRRHKSDSTMSTSAPPNGTQASFQPPHAGPSVLQDEPEGDPDALPPLSPSQGSTTEDEDWGEVIDGRHHAPYGHRNSAGSTTSISTRNSGPDLSWGARAIGAGGFEPLDADASSLPSGPSSLATSLPVFQPSPRAASVPLAVLGRVDSWDADGLVPLKPHPVMQTLVPPRTSMSSPLRSEFSLLATHDVEDSPDDHDDRPPSLMRHVPHRNVRPPTPPTQSRNKDRRYNEDDGSDSGSDDEGETDEGHNFVQMRRRPSTSTSTQNSPSTQSSGGQSPATSPPTRALSLGVPVGVGLTHA
ncbi:hypothetical protein BKA62DRAFT_448795 [Auriculariales sp. MPI-PUGE-AT-0066]|nr:hypothetical protein BKA62DRAFT_448795 [Auriculariales sp. MPI-PUGE-AT-0066]